jgi:2-keto-myo-inositol isomerase
MVAPQLSLADFFGLAKQLGITEVEIRNDITGKPILDGTSAHDVRALAADNGISIISINALQKFNHWSADRAKEAAALAKYAQECGSSALVLVAANDGTGLEDAVRVRNAAESLRGLKPILSDAGVTGLVECLGFEICSLRKKSEAVEAIDAAQGRGVFKLTHDTFHHYLAGETAIFPELIGLIHISGVDDPKVGVRYMRDSHRVLVGTRDRLGNIDQIKALRTAGYVGPLSFEPFAEELRTLGDPARAVRESMEFIEAQLAAMAA